MCFFRFCLLTNVMHFLTFTEASNESSHRQRQRHWLRRTQLAYYYLCWFPSPLAPLATPLCPLGWPEHCGYHSLTSFQRAWNFFGLQNAESAMWKTRNAKALKMLKMLENACIKLFIVSAARNANAAKYCIKSSLSLCHDPRSPFATPLPTAGVLSERAPFCLASAHFVNLPAQKPKESCLRLQMPSSSSYQRHFETQISLPLSLSLYACLCLVVAGAG